MSHLTKITNKWRIIALHAKAIQNKCLHKQQFHCLLIPPKAIHIGNPFITVNWIWYYSFEEGDNMQLYGYFYFILQVNYCQVTGSRISTLSPIFLPFFLTYFLIYFYYFSFWEMFSMKIFPSTLKYNHYLGKKYI